MKTKSIVASVLSVICVCCVSTSWGETKVSTLTSAINGEPQQIDGGVLNMDADFDLGTGKLTLTGVTSITGSGKFTGSAGSELDIEFVNTKSLSLGEATTLFTGDMKLTIRGTGTVRLPKKSTHTGGTVVCGGVVDGITGSTRNLSNSCLPFGASNSRLKVSGGTVLIHAYYNMNSYYSVVMSGGCLQNNAEYKSGNVFNAPIIVDSDSTLEAKTYDFPFKPSSISGNGKLTLIGDGGGFTIEKSIEMPMVGLVVAAPFALGAYNLEVNDYEVTTETAPTGTGTIKVNGIFKPTTANFCSVVLQNGASIDLTGWEGKAVVNADGNQVAFAEAATITLDVGDRTVEDGDTVLVWADGTQAADYEGRIFKIIGTNVASGLALEATAEGIKTVQASQNVVTALWKGKGDVNNWEDSANWICYNAIDAVIPNGVPEKSLTVTFTGDVSGVPFANDFPFAGARLTDANLSANVDWSAVDLGKITQDSVLDISGHTLKIASGSGSAACSATIKSSVQSGKVEWTIPEGATYTNDTLTLAGELDLVKLGAGTFVAKKCPQEFNGVTIVREGILKPGMDNVNATAGKSPFGGLLTIDLEKDGTLDPAGSYAWGNHTINLNGGKISNTAERRGRGTAYNSNATEQFNPCLKLYADTLFETTEMFNFEGRVLIQDKNVADMLTIQVPTGKTFLWAPTASNGNATEDLHLMVTGGGELEIWRRLPVLADKNPGFTLEIADATLNMDYYSSANTYEGGMGVVDYISSCTSDKKNKNVAVLSVSGTFTPNTDYFYGATMLGDSSINLADKTEAWSIDSKDTGVTHTLKFAGGKVTLKLGGRTLNPGDQILAWTTRPVGVEFAFEGDNVDSDVQVVWGDEGLYYGYAEEPQIVWTNSDGDNDLTNPNNWDPVGVPTDTKATFTGDVSDIKVPEDKSFDATKIWFNNAELSKNADFSWLNLANVANESILDIKGHTLTLKGCEGECTSAGMITSSEENGLVKFEVPAGSTYTNANFIFDGKLAFDKIGDGVLVAAKYPQTYTGKTTVESGVLRCAEGANMNAQNGLSPFGASRTVVIEDGSFLDPAGSYLWGYHTIEMNGGAISNTVKELGANSTAYNAGSFPKPFNPTLVLNEDSFFISPVQFNFNGVICPNGHKLTIRTAYELRWAPTNVNAAEVEFTGKGHLVTLKNTTPKMNDITLVMNDFTFDVGCWMAVSNYTAMAGNTDPVSSKDCWHEGGMTVSGTFTPTANKFFGCQMLNGSTIDLSGKKSTWSTTTDSSYENGPLTVTFANNAKVTIDVHDREFTDGEQVVTWTTAPDNIDGLTFELDAASKDAGYKLEKTDAGLFARVDTGSEITVEEMATLLPMGLDGQPIDFTSKNAAEIKKILDTTADNGLSVNKNIILGITQDNNGQFTKKPYLKADASAGVEDGKIKFAFGGITPKTDKADITYTIESAGTIDATNWDEAARGSLQSSGTTATAALPDPGEGESAVKYFKVRFNISEKAKTVE